MPIKKIFVCNQCGEERIEPNGFDENANKWLVIDRTKIPEIFPPRTSSSNIEVYCPRCRPIFDEEIRQKQAALLSINMQQEKERQQIITLAFRAIEKGLRPEIENKEKTSNTIFGLD